MNDVQPFEEWAEAFIPAQLPPGWRMQTEPVVKFYNGDGLSVLLSGRVEADQKRWIHISLARPNRLPAWDEVKRVKEIFFGPGRLAVQVHPRRDDYVNIHPYCLHLWHCVDGDPVPDFRHRGII